MIKMGKLFPHVPFIRDETPMSWAVRQAAFHTGGRVVPFLNDLGIPSMDLVRGKLSAVERLCDATGQARALVLHNTIAIAGKRRFSLRGQEFSAEFTTGAVTRFCPLCLQDDVAGHEGHGTGLRHRMLWRLSPVRTCPTHLVPLSDVRLGKWSEVNHELPAMRSEIAAEQSAIVDRERRQPSPVQCYVEGRLEGKAGPAWLDQQGIDQVCRTSEMLGGLMLYGSDRKASEMSEDTWDAAGRVAWPLMIEGPEQVQDFLAQTLKGCCTQNGRPSPRGAFGMLYRWLFASRLSKDPGPIRDIVREVIIDQVPLVPGQRLLGKNVTYPRLACISSIASSEGMHSKTLENVLRVAGVIGEKPALEGAPNVVLDYARAKELIDNTKYAIPVTRVPALLSASRPIVAELIDIGELTRIQEHDALQSKLGKAIDARSMQKTLNFLKVVGEKVGEPPEGFFPLAKAAEKSRINLRAILEMLFRKYLDKVYLLEGQTGFKAVLVSPAEISECVRNPPPDASNEICFCI